MEGIIDNGEQSDKLSNVIFKLLNQKSKTLKSPVLSKRKTTIMQEISLQKEAKRIKKNEYELKKVKKIRQMEIPSFANSEKEKLLKKNATKGGRNSLRYLIIPFFKSNFDIFYQ
jgi:hypothetical protein